MSIDLTTGCTRDERGHNFNCHKICQWCNRPKDEIELEKLRGLLRWRKWPEEKPVTSGRYLVLTDGSTDIGNHVSYWSRTAESWSTKDAGIAHWRPIGPLPGGE